MRKRLNNDLNLLPQTKFNPLHKVHPLPHPNETSQTNMSQKSSSTPTTPQNVNRLCDEYSRRIAMLHTIVNPTRRYDAIWRMLREILDRLTDNVPFAFQGPYAQMSYVAKSLDDAETVRQIKLLRWHASRRKEVSTKELSQWYEGDIRGLKTLIGILEARAQMGTAASGTKGNKGNEMGDESEELAMRGGEPLNVQKRPSDTFRSLRVTVVDATHTESVRVEESTTNEMRVVNLSKWAYMVPWLSVGTTLSLIYGKWTSGDEEPWLVIYEPDILINVTEISSCMTSYADSADIFTLKQLGSMECTHHILLGNLASQFLSEHLYAMRSHLPFSTNYKQSAQRFFKNNAIKLATTAGIDREWHQEAKRQQTNVAMMLDALNRSDKNFDADQAQAEASFVCAELGVQGRMDMLQDDLGVLIEQKSGQMDKMTNSYKEEHYAQTILYKLILQASYGLSPKSSQYLMYSKYEPQKGLVDVSGNYPSRTIEMAFGIRNKIVHNEIRYTNEREMRRDLLSWTPDDFREKNVSDMFWETYIAPGIAAELQAIQNAEPLAQSYFFAMASFLKRESMITSVGGDHNGHDGYSALWTASAEERQLAGSMIANLTFDHAERDEEYDFDDEKSIVILNKRSTPPTQGAEDGEEQEFGGAQTNFRPGDPVLLYSYREGEEPSVLTKSVHRATLLLMEDGTDGETTIALSLRSATTTKSMETPDLLWAMDHDKLGSTTKTQLQLLTELLRTRPERRAMLLGTRRPTVDSTWRRIGEYGPMNELIERQLRARDIFMLMGPPGTGKTSFGLVNILKEELLREGHNVLLLSYTNRAVDEICSKLEEHGLNYLRVGTRLSCSELYRHRLMQHQKGFTSIDNVRRIVEATRIFVGTTSSLGSSNSVQLFSLKHFDLAIVDEASQILEPGLVGLLSLRGEGGRPAIGRTVLIGDHRQLPAVVTQSRKVSKTRDEKLRQIGLDDCRNSFFERMMRLWGKDPELTYMLTKQGRMHPEVAAYSNQHFYGSQLSAVGLEHQMATLNIEVEEGASALEKALATRRTMYIDSKLPEGQEPDPMASKSNVYEAQIVARVALTVLRLRLHAGLRFDADHTLGIVVPYRNQILTIRRSMTQMLNVLSLTNENEKQALLHVIKDMTIDTVERLQGSERDVIIYGFTVNRESQLRFLTESRYEEEGVTIDRKLNVALTRAREQLIVVGDSSIIKDEFGDLIEACGEWKEMD